MTFFILVQINLLLKLLNIYTIVSNLILQIKEF